jgi:hypothetical protein
MCSILLCFVANLVTIHHTDIDAIVVHLFVAGSHASEQQKRRSFA